MKIFLLALILISYINRRSLFTISKCRDLMEARSIFLLIKGKKIMIVNTASKCGNTPQYADLEKLYEKYKDKLVIVGFPANNFGEQEPGTNTEIQEFCKKNYGVSFPMAEKVSVKGDDMAPIYKWLVEQSRELAKAEQGTTSKDLVWKRLFAKSR